MQILEDEGYRFIRTLGQGQYGVVILATKNNRNFALKMSSNIKTYQAEVLILTLLGEHPNIVPYYGSFSMRSLNVILLGFIPGQSLLEILMITPLSEAHAHKYFRQLVAGMTHAHEVARIAHLDLKAENLMISKDDGNLLIIDWGMSVCWSKDSQFSQSCGSPDYAAPEVYKKKPYLGPEVDVWAMGVILFAMVTSNFPFPGETPFEIGYRVCKGQYNVPIVSPELSHLISRMLTVAQPDRIKLHEIREHPWFKSKQLTESLSASVGPSSSLHKSKYEHDVYSPAHPVPTSEKTSRSRHRGEKSRSKSKDPNSRRHTKPHSEIKTNTPQIDPGPSSSTYSRTPKAAIASEKVIGTQLGIRMSRSSSSEFSDLEEPAQRASMRELPEQQGHRFKPFSLLAWKKKHQTMTNLNIKTKATKNDK